MSGAGLTLVAWGGLFASMLAAGATAAEPAGIRHNPFARPQIDRSVSDRAATDARESVSPRLDLRITLVAGSSGYANIDGQVLKVGDQTMGYTLVRVYEDRAEFRKGGDRLVVYVRDETDGKDARRND